MHAFYNTPPPPHIPPCKSSPSHQKQRSTPQGLQQRDAKQRSQLDELSQSLSDAQVELACFKALQEREQRAAPERAEALKALLAAQRERELEVQQRFKALKSERDDLLEELRAGARGQQQRRQAVAAR